MLISNNHRMKLGLFAIKIKSEQNVFNKRRITLNNLGTEDEFIRLFGF